MRTLTLSTTLLALVLTGCKNDEKPAAEPKARPAIRPDLQPPTDPEPPPPPEPEAKPRERQSIGVPECDDYLAKYSGCLKEKVPVGTRTAMERQLQITWEEWEKAVRQPGGKQQLARACKTAFDAMATAMKAFGCEW